MPRGSKPGERRGGRQRGTPNKKTVLKDAVFCAAAARPDGSPLGFMLGLMRDPNVPTDLRLDMAAAAARFVHAKPQAPPRVRTNAMASRPLEGLPAFVQPKLDGVQARFDSTPPEMEAELNGPEPAQENGVGGNGVGGNEVGVVGDYEVDLSPLQFVLRVMKDPDATPKQRIKAARVAARYIHVTVPPDKMAAVDEYGFAISGTLANAIKEDWLELGRLGVSSKAASRFSELLARQAKRDEFLRCPAGYSAEPDLKRRDELLKKGRRRVAEETELAFVIARITASEAAFNRSTEGQARRRIADLKYRREAANMERDRRVGLTRAEGKELDELVERYPPVARRQGPRVDCNVSVFDPYKARAAAGPDPDSEMEELAPTIMGRIERRRAEKEELIARRKAAGDPDPWGGEAPSYTIHQLEVRCFQQKLTAEEEDELQQLTRLYPKEVEKIGRLVKRRMS